MSHVTKLPDDVITPVVPPPLPSSSFELPSLQHHHHNSSVEKGSRAGRPVSFFHSLFHSFLILSCSGRFGFEKKLWCGRGIKIEHLLC